MLLYSLVMTADSTKMSDKAKFLWSALISYGVLIFILLPVYLTIQGSKAHETSVFLVVTFSSSIPVVLGMVTVGHSIFSSIKSKVTFNNSAAVFCGAIGVAVILSGLANIVGFVAFGEVSTDMAGFFLYPTLTISSVAAVVYLGFERWS